MVYIFWFIFLVSAVSLIIGLISPQLLMKIIKKDKDMLSRKFILVIYGTLILFSIIMIGIYTEDINIKEIIAFIFFIICILSLLLLIVGIIKPKIALMWKEVPTRLYVIILYSMIMISSFIMIVIIEPKSDTVTVIKEPNNLIHQPTIQQAEKQNKVIKEPKQETKEKVQEDKEIKYSNQKINVSMKAKIQNNNGKITIKGTTNLPNKTRLSLYLSNDATYTKHGTAQVNNGNFTSDIFTNKGKPLLNGNYKVSISIDYKPFSEKQPKEAESMLGKNGKNLIGKIVKIDSYSEHNNIDYSKSFKVLNSTKQQAIKSLTSTNINNVIASLKKNYNIKATAFNNEKLNKFKMCWNDRSCQVYADKVQIQGVYKKIEVYTSSMVSPQYYQKVCKAVMISLTGANRQLIEELIPQYFNYASKNGGSKWEQLGIEITISPDSQGLLGCSFYKR